jgi:hypothetical protein
MSSESQRDHVCDEYDKWFRERVKNKDERVMNELRRLWSLHKGQGEVRLKCFCAPRRCHGDTVARFLNSFLENS